MARRLRFDGDGWGDADRTWFKDQTDAIRREGRPPIYRQVIVEKGAEVDYDRVLDAETYIERGLAIVIDDGVELPPPELTADAVE